MDVFKARLKKKTTIVKAVAFLYKIAIMDNLS
jgi:hypothetical protein